MSDLFRGCPFCGSKNIEFDDCKGLEECKLFESCDEPEEYHVIVCNVNKGGCGASSGYFDTKEKAIAAWNRRTNENS